MDNPNADAEFVPRDQAITRIPDGLYAQGDLPDHATRIIVESPPGTELWKNPEMTGYFKVVRTYYHDASSTLGRGEEVQGAFQAYSREDTQQ
jgi:hypothetical protein